MPFDYDPAKSTANSVKHGLDFEDAQKLWLDEHAVIFPAKSENEPRFAILGNIDDRLWIGFYTIRDKNIRIISVRRARKGERLLYES